MEPARSSSAPAPHHTEIRRRADIGLARMVELASAVVCFFVSSAILAGWHLGSTTLTAVRPGYTPVQYNTALAFLACAVGLAGGQLKRKHLAVAAGMFVVVLSGATALEFLAGISFGIDTLFFPGVEPSPGRMAPNTVVALLACGIGLLLSLREGRWSAHTAAVLGSSIAALGAVPLAGYAGGVTTAYQWYGQKPMAVLTACLLVAVGVGIVAALWRRAREAVPEWLPVAAFVSAAFVSVLLVDALLNVSRGATRAEVHSPLVLAVFVTVVFGVAASVALAAALALARRAVARSIELETINRKLDQLNRALRLVSACDQALAHAEDEGDLLLRICRLAVDLGGYSLAWIGFADKDERKTVRAVAKAGAGIDYVNGTYVTWADEPRGHGPTGTAIRTGKPARCRYVITDPDFAPWRERARRFGFRSSLVVPLLEKGHAFGALSIYAPDPNAFDDREVELFQELAADLSYGIRSLRLRSEHQRAEQQLRKASLYARSLLESSLDPLLTISKEGRIMDVNRATEQVTGVGREELVGSDFCDYFTEPEKAREGYQRVFAEGEVRDYALAIRSRGGAITDVVYNASLFKDEEGRLEGVFAAARDITARKRAEEELQRSAEELKRSNNELQEFAFVASHDLQEPLRKITAFSERLRECAYTRLDATSQDYLARMNNAAARMSRLIESLLEYSRVTSRALPFERVDLAEVVLGVIADLEQRIRETGAGLTIGLLPVLHGDPMQLRRLMQNLIANALKFHAPAVTPRISVRAQPSHGCWQISVSDNGIGFDPAFAERIFRPFQRLHGRNEYEGSGMGLAICRKIAQRHGATITVNTEAGRGATFLVTFPPTPEHPVAATAGAAHAPDHETERSDSCREIPFVSCSPKMMTTTTC